MGTVAGNSTEALIIVCAAPRVGASVELQISILKITPRWVISDTILAVRNRRGVAEAQLHRRCRAFRSRGDGVGAAPETLRGVPLRGVPLRGVPAAVQVAGSAVIAVGAGRAEPWDIAHTVVFKSTSRCSV